MRTSISIPGELFRAVESAAKRLKLSRSELIQRALSAFLERHDDGIVTDALNKVYRNQSAAKLDPLLDCLQRLSLPREEW
jgi:metal-responsive CopG/Arc/MetJ family transcriptional regulator